MVQNWFMEKRSKQPDASNIYDWLELPVSRAPSFLKKKTLDYSNFEKEETMNIVNESSEFSSSLLTNSSQTNDHLSGAVIPPMLAPQSTMPEYFMSNKAKAVLASEGIQKISFEHFKKAAGFDYDEMAWLIGVARNTLINKKGAERFDISISEKIISLAELFTHGIDVFGSMDSFKNWLVQPNRALGMVTPFSLLCSQYGRNEVDTILGRIEWGVYS